MNVKRFAAVFMAVLLCGCLLAPPPAGADELAQAWSIKEAIYTGEVQGEGARLTAELTIQLLQEGWQEIPLAFQGAEITGVKVKGGSASILVRDDQYVLAVEKKGTYKIAVELSTRLTRDSQYEGIEVGIPQAVFSRLNLSIPKADVELEPELALIAVKKAGKERTTLTVPLGFSRSISCRWAVRPIQETPVEPVYTAEVQVLDTLQEETFRMTALLNLHLLQGELKSFVFDLPASLTVTAVRGVPVDEWKSVPDGAVQHVTASFDQPLRVGGWQVVVDAEQPLPASGETVLPSCVPLGAKRLDGYIAVANETSMELKDPSLDGLRRIDVRELPAGITGMATSPVIAAFRFAQAPYRAEAAIYRPQELPVLVAIAESAELSTVVTPTGERITRAVYQIRNNKKAFLEALLPKGATLWSVLADRRAVKPAAGENGRILIPLSVSHGTETAFPVEIVYVEKSEEFRWAGRAQYQGPVLDVPVAVVQWHLFLPAQVQGVRFAGNLERDLQVAGFLPDGDPVPFAAAPQVFARDRREEVRFQLKAKNAQRMAECAAAADELQDFSKSMAVMQQTGVLPFRISIPRSGRMYRFGRLLSTSEPLSIEVRYMKLPVSMSALCWAGLIGLGGIGGGLRLRRRRAPVQAA